MCRENFTETDISKCVLQEQKNELKKVINETTEERLSLCFKEYRVQSRAHFTFGCRKNQRLIDHVSQSE